MAQPLCPGPRLFSQVSLPTYIVKSLCSCLGHLGPVFRFHVFCEQLPLLLPHPPHQLSLLSSERDLYGPERGLWGFRQEILGSQVTEVWPGGRSETQASGGHSHVTRWAPRSVGRAAAIGKPGQGSLWCGSQDRGPSCCDLVGALNVPVFEITFLLKSNYGLYSFFFTTCLLTRVLLRGFFLEI